MIRRARLDDIDALVKLGIEAMQEVSPFPNMRIDHEKVRDMAQTVVANNMHFCWVCETDEGVVGAVSAFVHDMDFYERKQASIVQFYCKAPGEGVRLLREFLRWARARRIIKMIVFSVECGADPRIGKLLERLGLSKEFPIYVETR